LAAQPVRCPTATSDRQLQANLTQILALVRKLGAKRIDQLNGLIQTVAAQGQVPVQATVVQPLFVGAALRSDYTVDGVHLNDSGKAVYRKGLLGLVQQPSGGRAGGSAGVAGKP
jgi:lysophospholipase L1-like esterase